jgi:dihydroflavonol-4-reductase
MKVLVTGGTGFVGANVVRRLLAHGHAVRCVLRSTSKDLTLQGLDIERVTAELTDPEQLRRAMDGCEVVQHVAGVYDPGPGGEDAMRRIHVDATRAMLEAARAAGVRRVVVCSSSITVGWGPITAPGDEETPLDPDVYGRTGPLRAYHDTKAESERLAREARGVEAVVVNPDYVIGPWDVKPTSGALIVMMANRWIPVFPRGGKCFVDAEDCAEAHVAAMTRGTHGRRYLLGAHNRSYQDFMRLVATVVGCRPPVAPLPRRVTTLVRGFPQARLLLAMQEERYRSGRRAVEELGMPVRPLEDSIEAAYRWFVDHGYVRR